MKKNDDIPLQRTLRIGRATVGLIGLDVVLNKILGLSDITEDEAVDIIMKEVSQQNYIPASAREQYSEALRREYRRHHSGDEQRDRDLSIKILGKACVSCNKLNTMTFDILQEMGVAADIELIHDPDEIWRHGVLTTPALIINGEVMSSGKIPRRSEVEEWLRDAIEI